MREVLFVYFDRDRAALSKRVPFERREAVSDAIFAAGGFVFVTIVRKAPPAPSEWGLESRIREALALAPVAKTARERASLALRTAVRAGTIFESTPDDVEALAPLMDGPDPAAAAARWLTGAEALMQEGRVSQ
ncbi:hypothetical protein [Albimonas pacifica]|uniref:Uncharacterized protein n=1 Tax=Albimonas pacifica TaxID=1114924 RepID=A0A1I3FW20_9RHOB|nr:hypothetical protein [Albimonas pacifica]SFI15272.1 hypothetical protein SAMN05216258_104548 [Albimonas pacifica]